MRINFLMPAALVLALASCSEGKKETKEVKPVEVKQQAIGTLKIAFYDQDTLAEKFKYFKEQEAVMEKKQKAFQTKVDQMTNEYQDFLRRNDEKNRQGLLSQLQIQNIQEQAAMKERAIVEFQQSNGGRLEKEAIQKMEDLNKKVEVYSKMFSEQNKIDILLIKAKGGQLAFVAPAMNVTQSFIDFLNAKEEEIKKDISGK